MKRENQCPKCALFGTWLNYNFVTMKTKYYCKRCGTEWWSKWTKKGLIQIKPSLKDFPDIDKNHPYGSLEAIRLWKEAFEEQLRERLANAEETIFLEQGHRADSFYLNPKASEMAEEFAKGEVYILKKILGDQ